jgi:cytochrome c-type biogenesis protein
MTFAYLAQFVLVPLGLGLLGFAEPCSIGSTLIFIKHIEGKGPAGKLTEVGIFTVTRAVFIGLLGMLAVLLGTAFLGLQRAGWMLLGAGYVGLGLLYLTGKAGRLMVSLGPSLSRLSSVHSSATLGVLFGLNIPACATPLMFALFAAATASGATGGTIASAFISLALFGLALSLPLVVVVFFDAARRTLDWMAGLSRRLPVWTGLLLVALGFWSIWFGLFSALRPSRFETRRNGLTFQ